MCLASSRVRLRRVELLLRAAAAHSGFMQGAVSAMGWASISWGICVMTSWPCCLGCYRSRGSGDESGPRRRILRGRSLRTKPRLHLVRLLGESWPPLLLASSSSLSPMIPPGFGGGFMVPRSVWCGYGDEGGSVVVVPMPLQPGPGGVASHVTEGDSHMMAPPVAGWSEGGASVILGWVRGLGQHPAAR